MTTAQAVANTLAVFFRAVDARDWATVTSLMTDPFHLDYASFGAGPPADLAPETIVAGWRSLLPGFDHTHHQLGNVAIDLESDTARIACYGTATHVIDQEVWTVVGQYRVALIQREDTWLLSKLRFLFRYQHGAIHLPSRAQERAADHM